MNSILYQNTSVSKLRDSNLELYRIIVMLLIVTHHYVVNSGLLPIMAEKPLSYSSIFLYLMGMWGKTGINCFVLITGYFMCKSNITIRKFLKLLLEIEFYNIAIYLIFTISGYETFSIKGCLKSVLPITSVSNGFTSCFLLFYLFIPFLNILINQLSKKQHLLLISLCLFTYTILGSLPKIDVTMNYVSWFCVLYIISSYFRIYGLPIKVSRWKLLTILSVLLSILSVLGFLYLNERFHLSLYPYRLVSDSNSIFAILTGICSFMFFKNLKIKNNKIINLISRSAFGVLLIHANSDTMRQWLWNDTLNNLEFYQSPFIIVHLIISVLSIYIICTLIDYLRINYVETPLFKTIDKYYKKIQ